MKYPTCALETKTSNTLLISCSGEGLLYGWLVSKGTVLLSAAIMYFLLALSFCRAGYIQGSKSRETRIISQKSHVVSIVGSGGVSSSRPGFARRALVW